MIAQIKAQTTGGRKPLRGKKTWREKLYDDKDLPKITQIEGKTIAGLKSGSMVIPAPRDVDALMRRVPRGKLATIDELRAALAGKYKTAAACPITTGIFAWIAAYAADEAAAQGEKSVTPYWRTLKAKGEVNPKYPGGLAGIATRLEAEGHAIIYKGKRAFVRDFEKSLISVRALISTPASNPR